MGLRYNQTARSSRAIPFLRRNPMTREEEINQARGNMRMRLFYDENNMYSRYWLSLIRPILQTFFENFKK